MNNIIVFCQTNEKGESCQIGLELLTEGRRLAAEAGVKLEAVVIGHGMYQATETIKKYGAQTIYCADEERLKEYETVPYAKILTALFEQEQPSIVLFGATDMGRDLAPRVACALGCGLTADCTSLEIADYNDKNGTRYEKVLHQTRPAFLGNLLTTIVSPSRMPQMATLRGGLFGCQPAEGATDCKLVTLDTSMLNDNDFSTTLHESIKLENKAANIATAKVIVAGGYGMGSKENFDQLYKLASLLGGEVGATRAAIDAGYANHDGMIGQTGITVRPKLYFACGISGQVQHTAGMDKSDVIVSINNDPEAPIHKLADYAIVGDVNKTVAKLIEYFSQNK